MKKLIILTLIFFFFVTLVQAQSDISIWSGQYYENTFKQGTYTFSFTVYDDFTNGNICYTNTTNLTTDNLGRWRTIQYNVSSSCNMVLESYFLEIKIDGIIQGIRRKLMLNNYLVGNMINQNNNSMKNYIDYVNKTSS